MPRAFSTVRSSTSGIPGRESAPVYGGRDGAAPGKRENKLQKEFDGTKME